MGEEKGAAEGLYDVSKANFPLCIGRTTRLIWVVLNPLPPSLRRGCSKAFKAHRYSRIHSHVPDQFEVVAVRDVRRSDWSKVGEGGGEGMRWRRARGETPGFLRGFFHQKYIDL